MVSTKNHPTEVINWGNYNVSNLKWLRTITVKSVCEKYVSNKQWTFSQAQRDIRKTLSVPLLVLQPRESCSIIPLRHSSVFNYTHTHTLKGAGPQRSPIRLNQRYTKGASVIMFYVGAVGECERKKWEKWVALSFTAGGIGSSESHQKKKKKRETFFKEGKEKLHWVHLRGRVAVVWCCWGRQWTFPFFCFAQTKWNVSAHTDHGSIFIEKVESSFSHISETSLNSSKVK